MEVLGSSEKSVPEKLHSVMLTNRLAFVIEAVCFP